MTYDPNMPPAGMPPVTPRRRHHYIRWIFAGIGALILLIIVIAVAAGGGGSKPPAATPSTPAATTPAATAIATPSVNPATKVTFIVTGQGNPSITYGSDSDNRDGGGQLGQMGDGNALPWSRSLTFSGDALYYSISAQLEGGGDISCKIVVTGPGDEPLTVASGHASGSYNICSAQAAPDNADGTSWTKE